MRLVGKLRNIVSNLLLRIVTNQILLFVTSFFLGVLLALSLHLYQISVWDSLDTDIPPSQYDYAYELWLESRGLRSEDRDPDIVRYHNRSAVYGEDQYHPHSEAAFLYREIRVFCLVFPTTAGARIAVTPGSSDNALTIRNTWGKRCNRVFFYNDKQEDPRVPVIKLPSKSAFGLLCEAIRRIVEEGEVFDWILVTTEDTFALPENFRHYVAPFNASEPHYLGHPMKFWNQVYNWGEAGYALSRGAVSLLTHRFNSSSSCQSGGKYWKNSDWYLGKHLASMGVQVKDTRDHLGRGRFNGYSFKKLLFPGAVSLFDKYWKDSLYLSEDGPKCCSSKAITFKGILSKSKMYQLEYLFYHLRPFEMGGVHGNVAPPPRKEDPFLTEEERLKNSMMQEWFDQQLTLMTTPKNMLWQATPSAEY